MFKMDLMGICIINMDPKNIYYPLGKESFRDIFGVGCVTCQSWPVHMGLPEI